MNPALLIRLVPLGPWRTGEDSGAGNRVSTIYHSDSLYSAVTQAMAQLGELEEWLRATALAPTPEVRFSSCFPWQGKTLYVVPPRALWPPAGATKLHLKSVRFVPVSLIPALVSGQPLDEERWSVDGHSHCLAPNGENGDASPFRIAMRTHVAWDRLSGVTRAPRRTACLEFAPDAGLWLLAAFSGEDSRSRWSAPVEACFRLLADSGFGGKRSIGWGRTAQPHVISGQLPELVVSIPEADPTPAPTPESDEAAAETNLKREPAYWLLSLFRPGAGDQVDWSRGDYSLVTRSGRVESAAGSGNLKKNLRMIEEGSVLFAGGVPAGSAADVAPDGFPHPVFRYGAPVSIEIPVRVSA